MIEPTDSFYASSEYLIVEQHRHSKDRRRFFLFSAFDFALITILWVLFTVTKSPDWHKDFDEQCNFLNPKFFTISLFDVAILAFARFIWIILWYLCFNLHHWLPATISTGISTVFLLTKIVYFFLESSNQSNNPLAYAIPVCSFVAAWVELYLLDVQVLPNERAQEFLDQLPRSTSRARQRPPLFLDPGGVPDWAPRSAYESDYRTATELSSDEEAVDVAAADNPTGQQRMAKGFKIGAAPTAYKTFGRSDFINAGRKAMSVGKHLYNNVENWPLKKSLPLIRSTTFDVFGRFYYMKLETKVPVETLFDIIYTQSQSMPAWNKLVLESKVVLRVDAFTDVSYSVSSPALKNYIASRDFLDVRCYEQIGRTFFIATMFVRSNLRLPLPNSKIVRGENGPCLCVLKPSHVNENSSTFDFIMNTNLKGNLPKKLVENSLVQFLQKFADNLQNKLKTL